jgi:TPR repeat protein
MIRFALIVVMSLAVSSQAIAAIKWSNSSGSHLQKAIIAYEKGNFTAALRIFTPLAEKGDMVAQFNLAKMYREGKGVSKDYKTAVKWFSLSAEQGNATAQYHLGVAYSFGLGVIPNFEIALEWYTRSAEQGNTFAQHHLSLMYYFGNEVPEDKVYAHMWASLASANGLEMAEQLRQVLIEQMTPSQIEAALSLATVCKDRNLRGC